MTEKRYESDLTGKEKRQLEWQKIKGMRWKDRFSHIWAYYKPHMAVLLLIILAISVIGQMIYRSQFENVFSVAVLNGVMGDSEAMAEDFKAYLGDEDKYHEIMIDASMYFSGDDSADYTSVMKLTTLIGARELEAMIAPKDQFEHYRDMDAFLPMDELLTEEQMEAYGDDVSEYGLNVSGSPTLEKFGMGIGEDVWLGIMVNAEHKENAKEFITYIYEGGK
ncbi:MAG: hypothetical protein KH828_04125 [Clostridiales bacterium]|nr:hypothetical protein [Clostridiales bacterium]